MKRTLLALTIGMVVLLYACNENSEHSQESSSQEVSQVPEPVQINYTVLNAFPHDTAAFIQGLEVFKGGFLESTGLFKRSTLRKVDIHSGKAFKLIKNEDDIFAEGITVFNDTIYQLSWENHKVFLYETKDLKKIGELPWSNEGWGITHDDKQLIISDGSDKLYFVQPGTLKLNKVLSVSDNLGAVNNLNELEMVDGYVYANRWQYDYILKIDPTTGFIAGRLNMQDFLKRNTKKDLSYLTQKGSTAEESGAVLNGIAYDKEKKVFYITGKLWPEVFEIRVD
jgi:glutamine cyclotransferase